MSPDKAFVAIAKRTGGPAGMAVSAVWKGKDALAKVLIVIIALLLLPVMFMLTLPSLIFGSEGLDVTPDNVSNGNSAIMTSISQTEINTKTILREKHNLFLNRILAGIINLGTNCEYSVIDDFSDQITYESALIISRFYAPQQDSKEVQLKKLEQILRTEAGDIFTYSANITKREETIEGTNQMETVFHYEYIIGYVGNKCFSNHVFRLAEEQTGTVDFYASSLRPLLYDAIYSVEINPDLVPGETRNAAVDLGLTKLDAPYNQEPQNQPGYFDCSPFTYWAYNRLGVSLQHDGSNTAASQGRFTVENSLAVSYDSLASGGLIFHSFKVNSRHINIDHVATYTEDSYVVDVSLPKKKAVYHPTRSANSIALCGRPYASS